MFQYYYLPKKVDLETLIRVSPPEQPGIQNFDIDLAKYLLSLITTIPARDLEIAESLQESDHYVPISSVLMQGVVHNYKDYWTYFSDVLKIVDINPSYRVKTDSKSGQCKGYRFSKEYRKSRIVEGEYQTPIVIANLEKIDKIIVKEYGYLTKWFYEEKGLGNDYDQAIDFITKKKEAQELDPSLRGKKKSKPEEDRDPENQFDQSLRSLMLFKNNDFRCTVDESGSRFYSILTNMNSSLRNLITYKGNRLASIDIKNSQPYFSALLLQETFYKKRNPKHAKGRINYTKLNKKNTEQLERQLKYLSDIEAISKIPKNSLYIKLISSYSYIYINNIVFDYKYIHKNIDNKHNIKYNNNKTHNKINLKLIHMLELYTYGSNNQYFTKSLNKEKLKNLKLDKDKICNSLDIYEYMLLESKKYKEGKLGYETRKQMKPLMYFIFFSENTPHHLKTFFASMFPEVARLFRAIKKFDYKLLACLLQNIESYAMLKVIAKKISEEFPDMPLFTIHDSIVVPENKVTAIKSIIEEELIRLVGLRPGLKIEYWDPNNLKEELKLYEGIIEKAKPSKPI